MLIKEETFIGQAVRHAIRVAEKLPLPRAARSLTRAELIGTRAGTIGRAAVVLTLVVGTALFFAVREGGAFGAMLAYVALVAVATVLFRGWVWSRSFRDYRDPEIRIAADDSGVRFTNSAGTELIGWLGIEGKVEYSGSDGVYFTGLKLESPFGPILLSDDWYCDGRDLAAAIVAGMTRAEEARTQAKAGIVPV